MGALMGLQLLVLAAFIVGRLAEWRAHRGAHGLRGLYAATALVVPGAFVERFATGDLPSRSMIIMGAALAGVAMLIRTLAIHRLGRSRVVLSKPEYLSILVESAGVCLLLSAPVTLTLFASGTAAYGFYQASLERRGRLTSVDFAERPDIRS